jgi:4-hydroxy-4-methyl-2-oxoglutarate aldolase
MHPLHTDDADTSTTSSPAADPSWDGLTSALASDALDSMGHRAQCLGPDIRPMTLSQRVIGRAFTVRAVPATEIEPARPYEGLLNAIDHTEEGVVFVFHTDRSDASGVWGELLTTACRSRGVAGSLTDGLVRDVARVLTHDFPVFSRGATPYDSKGRVEVVAEAVEVHIDGVRIAPGDLIVGDADGVCVVPAELEQEVLDRVKEKNAGEGRFREAVSSGVPVTEAFRKYHVL